MKSTASRASAVSQTRGFGDLLYDKAGSRPSLDLDFAGTSSLRDKITGEYLVDHTRASTGTYIDNDGLIKSATTNLLLNSQLNTTTSWVKGGSSTFTPNFAIAPDGTQTAHRLQHGATSGTYLGQTLNGLTSGKTYVFSFWWKRNGTDTTAMIYYGGASHNHTIPAEWTRESFSFTVNSSSDFVQFDNIGASNNDYLIWHPQFEEGTTPTDYIETVSTVNSAPRFTHERVETGNQLASSNHFNLLADNQSNLRYAAVVLNGGGNTDSTLKPYAALSPDGKYNAAKLTFNHAYTSGDQSFAFTVNQPTVTKKCVFSFYAKTISGTATIRIKMGSNTTTAGGGDFTVTDQWQRFERSGVAADRTFFGISNHLSSQVGTSILIWGFQLEEEQDSATTYAPSIDTFTSRLSNATYVDSAGLIKTSAFNEFETSETFTNWVTPFGTYYQSMTVDIANPTLAPNGTLTATRLKMRDSLTTEHVIYKNIATPLNSYFSVHAKAHGLNFIKLLVQTNSNNNANYVNFDLANGTVHDEKDAVGEIISLGNGWYRCILKNNTLVGGRVLFEPNTGAIDGLNNLGREQYTTGNNEDGVEVWGWQLSNAESDYVQTTGTPSGGARYSHDPETLAPTGLYLEPAQTGVSGGPHNLVNSSGNPTGWSFGGSTHTANAAIAPDGTQTATKVVPTGTSHASQYQSHGGTDDIVFSGFFKSAGYRYVHLGVHGSPESRGAIFDVIDGTVARTFHSQHEAKIEKYPNGWFRCILRRPTGNKNSFYQWHFIRHPYGSLQWNGTANDLDDNVGGLYVWGINIVKARYESSFVYNTWTGQVTRAADVYTSTANLTETFEPRGLLIEEARTNFIPDHRQVNQTIGATQSLNAATAPDGTQTATRVAEQATNNRHIVYQTTNAIPTNSSISVFIKGETVRYVAVVLHNPSATTPYVIDTQEGIITQTIGYSNHKLEKYPNGWLRFSYYHSSTNNGNLVLSACQTPTTSGITVTAGSPVYNGNTSNTFLFWGLQAEAGSFETSPILTSGSQTTRSADIVSISGDNFGTYRTNLLSNSNLAGGRTHGSNNNAGQQSYGQNCTIINNYALSPISNKFDASKIIPDHNTAVQRILWQNFNNQGFMGHTITNPHTISFYAKADGCNFIHARSMSHGLCFNLSNGTTSTGYRDGSTPMSAPTAAGTVMEDLGGGWYRCAMRIPATNNNTIHFSVSNSATTTTVSGVSVNAGALMYGFHVEDGDKLTNYIPSTDTFTSRLGNATYVDSNGLIKTAYKNFFLNSNNFTLWSNAGNKQTVAGTVTAPDGTQTASKVVMNNVTDNNAVLYQATASDGAVSVYAKADGMTHVNLLLQNNSYPNGSPGAQFDLINGTVTFTANGTGEIIDEGNGWWKCILKPNHTFGGTIAAIQPNTGTQPSTTFFFRSTVSGDGIKGIHLWHAMQTDNKDDAGEYAPTVGTQIGGPRYSHDPETLVPTGLYLEPAATNEITRSTEMQGGNSGSLREDNTLDVVAPDGTNTAVRHYATAGGYKYTFPYGLHNNSNLAGVLGKRLSYWIKKGDYDEIRLTNGQHLKWVFSTKSFINSGTYTYNESFEEYPNGWFRLSYTIPENSNTTHTLIGVNPATADTTLAYYWGFQLEDSSHASSYIPTSGSTVTRPADTYTSTATTVFDRDGGNKEAFYNHYGARSIYFETQLPLKDWTRVFVMTGANGQSKSCFFRNNIATNPIIEMNYVTAAGTQYSPMIYPGNDPMQQAALAANNDGASLVHETTIATDSNVTIATAPDTKQPLTMYLGSNSNGSDVMNVGFNRLTFWKTRLPNVALTNITT